MILINDISNHTFDLYTDVKEAAGHLGMDRGALKRRLEKTYTFYVEDLMVTTKITIHKSRRGRKK